MKPSRIFIDALFKWLFRGIAALSVLVLLGIFGMLFFNGIQVFRTIHWADFFLGTTWNPSAFDQPQYGILAMLYSTILVTVGAMLIAVPLGIGAAAYLAQVATESMRLVLKPLIELLAAIPSVVVGFIGIVVLGPLIASLFGLSNGLTALNGSILLAIMSLPTIITVAEDAIRSVPNSFKEGAYALGANHWTTLYSVVLPAALPGILAAVILGVGRAIGETMTVLMATGNALAMPGGFFDPVRTMTATIAIELGEVPFDTPHYYSLFAVGAVLFLLSLAINLIAEQVANRFRYKI